MAARAFEGFESCPLRTTIHCQKHCQKHCVPKTQRLTWSSRSIPEHGQASRAAKHQITVDVRVDPLHLFAVQAKVGQPIEEGVERDAGLHASQVHAKAEVGAVPNDTCCLGSRKMSKTSGFSKTSGSRLADPSIDITIDPAGMSTPTAT
jgi:hypothetical protein